MRTQENAETKCTQCHYPLKRRGIETGAPVLCVQCEKDAKTKSLEAHYNFMLGRVGELEAETERLRVLIGDLFAALEDSDSLETEGFFDLRCRTRAALKGGE